MINFEYKLSELAKKLTSIDFTPTQQKVGDAGYDLRACIPVKSVRIHPEEVVKIPTGIHVGLGREDLVGLVIPRSSLGKNGGVLANTVGVIDSNYQGEIVLMVLNTNMEEDLVILQGERIAQLVVVNCYTTKFSKVEGFTYETNRAEEGFGSSGRM